MFLSGMPDYYVLYCILSLPCLFLIRKKWELNMRDTVITLVIIISFGLIVPLSLRIIGWSWTLLLLGLSAASVLLTIAAVRMREDRELEGQIEQVLKPSGSILPMPFDREEQNRETGQPIAVEETAASGAEEGNEPVFEQQATYADHGEENGDDNHVQEADASLALPEPEEPEAVEEVFAEPEPEEPEAVEEALPGPETPEEAVPPFPPADQERVQRHYETATEALRRRDYFTAYRELQQALSCDPPLAAKWLITRDLVLILKEMGLYRESMEALEKLLFELPATAEKKRTELQRQIAYLQILSRVLEAESKRNLSWSLIPVHIRSRADREYRESIETTV
jgi:tetratricopeptide (TPR) repeat protein